MCGISGIWDLDKNRSSDLPKIIRKMSGTLESRGPDDQGIWINNVDQICFGHKRLSILDLSQLGRQPMVKDRFVITYNGEIYNFKEIRKELESTKLKIRFNSKTLNLAAPIVSNPNNFHVNDVAKSSWNTPIVIYDLLQYPPFIILLKAGVII